MHDIRFGTDGWRAIIADGFTFDRVRLVSQAIALYLQERHLEGQGVVIGFDNRFLSERFASAVAEVMAGNGICSWLPSGAVPTPVTAFAIRHLQTGGGVMITASHNPPEYNGIKFIPDYAGPALPEITGEIEKKIQGLTQTAVRIMPLKEAREKGLVRELDPKQPYIEHLWRVLKHRRVGDSRLKIVLDPMWGAGIGYVDECLRDFCNHLEIIHNYRDVLYGGALPEPTAAGLRELGRAVVREEADLGLALDGDADRFGVIDSSGEYVSPNEILYLILYYLLEYRNWRGAVARTVATTHMLDRIAGEYGLPVVETPVGFKYIGQSLIKYRCILGGEESGGLSIQGHVPEKDGILALCLVVEMLAALKKPLKEIQNEVISRFGLLVSSRTDLRCDPKDRTLLLERLGKWNPDSLAGEKVVSRRADDGVKLVLEKGDWVLVRPSGTEPLFRVYAEVADRERLSLLHDEARRVLGL